MRRSAPLALVVALVIAALAPAGCARSNPKPEAASVPAQATCREDADCVLVPDDCCGCTAGGKQRAISAAERDAYEREREGRCAGTMCAQMISTDPSCSSRAACRGGACVLAPQGAEAP